MTRLISCFFVALGSFAIVLPIVADEAATTQKSAPVRPATAKPATAKPATAKPAKPTAPGKIDAKQIKSWLHQLDADNFSEREAASRSLTEAGAAAVEALTKALDSPSPEIATRSGSILKQHLTGKDDSLRTKVKAALAETAKGESAAATKAKKLLAAAKPELDAGVTQPLRPGGGFRIAPGIAIRVRPGGGIRVGGGGVRIGPGGIGTRLQISSTSGGSRSVSVQENGKKIEIKENKKDGIKISVTAPVDGKDKTTKYAAKDKEELKKKHPEAAKLYDKYMGKSGTIRIGGPVIIGGGIVGGLPGIRPFAPPRGFGDLDKEFEARLKEMQKLLKDDHPAFKKLLEQQKQLRESTKPRKALTEKQRDAEIARIKKQLKELQAREKKLREEQKKLKEAVKEKELK